MAPTIARSQRRMGLVLFICLLVGIPASASAQSDESTIIHLSPIVAPTERETFRDPEGDTDAAMIDMSRIWIDRGGSGTVVVLQLRQVSRPLPEDLDWRLGFTFELDTLFRDPYYARLEAGVSEVRDGTHRGSARFVKDGAVMPATFEMSDGAPGYVRFTFENRLEPWVDSGSRRFSGRISLSGGGSVSEDQFSSGGGIPGIGAPLTIMVLIGSVVWRPRL